MTPEQVQTILADFQRHAAQVDARRPDGRETWRFRVGPHVYDLHFYDRGAGREFVSHYVGGGDAAREFQQLQALQKLAIPAVRVVANLKGFRFGDRKGDACIVVVDPADLPLDALLRDAPPRAGPGRMRLLADLFTLLESLHDRKLTPTPLHVHAFARRGDRMIVADGSRPFRGIVDADRLAELDQSTRHVSTATDRLRAWRHFRDDAPPRRDGRLRRLTRRLVAQAKAGAGSFGTIEHEGWVGRYVRHVPLTLPWSRASGMHFDAETWQAALPTLLAEDRPGEIMKNDTAATIVARDLAIAGTTLRVVLKRPRPKPGLFHALRRSRAMRSWLKTWRMLGLGFACELPLLVLERQREQLLVFERVPGQTLAAADLDAMPLGDRERLIYAAGRTLRRIERAGFTHNDAKSTNWIVWRDSAGDDRPILIDLDGIRRLGWRGAGYERLARAIRAHPQFRPADLDALTHGYRRRPVPPPPEKT